MHRVLGVFGTDANAKQKLADLLQKAVLGATAMVDGEAVARVRSSYWEEF